MEKAQLAFLAASAVAGTSWYALRNGYFGRAAPLVFTEDKHIHMHVVHTQGLWQDNVTAVVVTRVDWTIFPAFHAKDSHPPFKMVSFASWRPMDVTLVPYEKAEQLETAIVSKLESCLLNRPENISPAMFEAKTRLAITEVIDRFE